MNGPPEWNEDRASTLVGKYALIGLTFLDEDDNLISQVQRHGRILEMGASRGIAIRLVAHGHHWDGEIYRLPPDLRAFVDAPPGEYRLRSTGEVVVDPDVTAIGRSRARRPRKTRPRSAELGQPKHCGSASRPANRKVKAS